MELEINGIKYAKIEKQPKKQMSRSMANVLMIASMFGGLDDIGGKTRQRPNIDLVEEFELVQKKASKLSRNDREWVVFQFNQRYKQIE